MAATIPYLIVGSTVLSAAGAIQQGEAARAIGESARVQYERQANESRAASQRASIEERRKARLAQSRLRALSAASGAGATDPTVVGLSQDIAGQGEYNALTRLYEGESRARGYETAGDIALYEGKAKQSAAGMSAISSIAEGGMSLYDRYGADLFSRDTWSL